MDYRLLDAREKTDLFEKKLLSEFKNKTLVVIRCNMPGIKKGCPESDWVVYKIFLECKLVLKPSHIFHSYTDEEGLIFFLIVDGNSIKIKEQTITIEETHNLGRLSDIDVLNSQKLFSRADILLKNKYDSNKTVLRKCFLCNRSAKYCSRNQTHSLNDIIEFIKTKVQNDWLDGNTYDKLSKLTEAAMLGELCRIYGFGCVTANDNGSHSDMDFLLMLDCIPLIGNAIKKITPDVYKSFSSLRNYGKTIEESLFKITKGINTYKGALFLLLILNACTLRVLFRNKKTDNIITDLPDIERYELINSLSYEISEFSKPVLKDISTRDCSKQSLDLFLQTGEAGIRGEALSGFKSHFTDYLPIFKSGINIEYIILHILSETFDTTIIKRKGIKKLYEVQNKAEHILTLPKIDIRKEANIFSEWCKSENISTGGSADRIIILYNLFLIDKFFDRLMI